MTQTFGAIKKYLMVEVEKMRRPLETNEDVVFNYNLDKFITILDESVFYYDFVKSVEKQYPEIYLPLYGRTMGNFKWLQQVEMIV